MKSLLVSKQMKKTKAGMIPVDWEVARLHEIAELKSGGTPSKSNLSFWGGDFPWVSAKDLKQSIVFDSIDHLSDSGVKGAKIAPKDSLLILVRGMTLYKDVPVCLVGGEIAFNQDIKAIVLKTRIFPNYLQFYMLSRKKMLLKLVDSAGHGTGRLDTTLLKNFPIAFPSYHEQKAIADLLSAWDEAVEKTELLIQAKEKKFKALRTKLLKKAIDHTSIHYVQLGKILDYEQPIKYIVESTDYKKEGKTPVLTANKSFILGYTTEQNGVFFNIPVIIFDDFTTDNKYVDFQFKVKSSAMKMLSPRKENLNLFYIFNAMSQIKVPLGGHKRYWISEYQFFDIPLPSYEIQTQIAQALSTIQQEIDLLKQQTGKYKTQKRGLMQKMLTGKWRVKDEIFNKYTEA